MEESSCVRQNYILLGKIDNADYLRNNTYRLLKMQNGIR